jgi:hypothetical protein
VYTILFVDAKKVDCVLTALPKLARSEKVFAVLTPPPFLYYPAMGEWE